MKRGSLTRTFIIVLACVSVLLPMTLGGVAAAGQGNVLGTQTSLAAETFMNEAMYLRFETHVPLAMVGTDSMYASLQAQTVGDVMLARANVSAINDLCAKMAAFFKVFQEYAEEEPSAAAILGQAAELQAMMQQVAMMRQGELDGLAARNEAGGMLASAAPGTYLAATDPQAEGELMDGLANFKKNFDLAY
ncbi:MAG: hypothetical protein ACYC99_11035 [Candidatus Geothermincolia bacterium]